MKLTKTKLKQIIREEIQKLNEDKKLVNKVDNLEQFIWHKVKNNKVKNMWDDYTEKIMDKENARYWVDVDDRYLEDVYDYGISLLKKYKIKYKER